MELEDTVTDVSVKVSWTGPTGTSVLSMGSTEKTEKSEFDEAFRHVAAEIGFLARAWNGLHDNLAKVFAHVMSPSNINIPIAVWNSLVSDLAQREMLRAATNSWAVFNKPKAAVVEEILWLINKCGDLSHDRNTALHSPINVMQDTRTLEFSIEPNYLNNNPKALKLKGKDVFTEISRYRAQAECLNQYAVSIWMHLASGSPLPHRPKLPSAGATPNPTKQHHPTPQP
jgi:hypothetical protein